MGGNSIISFTDFQWNHVRTAANTCIINSFWFLESKAQTYFVDNGIKNTESSKSSNSISSNWSFFFFFLHFGLFKKR